MKRYLLTIIFIHFLIVDAFAQTDSLSLSAIKAEIKSEVLANCVPSKRQNRCKGIQDFRSMVLCVTICRTTHVSV